jgi:outer membrane protein assembly factor BamA
VRGLLILLAIAGCQQPVHHPGEEWLAAITFEGNRAISSGDLRTGLALHRVLSQGSAPDPYLVAMDRERLKGKYVRRGYFEVDVHSRVERHGDATTVIYKIDEGPRATTRVEVVGLPADPALPLHEVRAKLALADGKPFDYDVYEQAKEPLLGVVQDAGYAHAKLDAHVEADRASHEAVVVLAYDAGPKCTFGNVTIQGASGDLADAVVARVTFDRGETFTTAAIAATQRAIYGMRRFSNVRVLPDKTDGDVIDVRVAVSDSARNELGVGGGFGIDPATYEARARLGYTILGWPFPLDTLDLDLRPAYAVLRDGSGYEPRIRALATLSRMDLFHPFVTGQIQGGYNYVTLEAYTMYGPIVRLGVDSPLGVDELKLRVGWELQRLDFRDVSPIIDPASARALGLDSTEQLGKLEQTITLDLRDHPIEPHEGLYAELRVAEGGPFALGNQSYEQVTPDLRGYVPIGDAVIAARVRYGAFYGAVPVSERYYAGGATTQRGFSEWKLAPTLFGMNGTTGSVPVGGGGLFLSSVELRARLTKVRGMGLGGVVFLDGGDVTERAQDLDLGNLNWAAGAGLRLFTLVGAIRFDVGYRLNRTGPREPEPGSTYAFHLSIGEAY